jgi:hypothetical protein
MRKEAAWSQQFFAKQAGAVSFFCAHIFDRMGGRSYANEEKTMNMTIDTPQRRLKFAQLVRIVSAIFCLSLLA